METKTEITDSRIPQPEKCVLPYVLRYFAERVPEKPFAVFDSGAEWSYADTIREVSRVAAGLRAVGVDRGDKVLVWLPNGEWALKGWFGVNWAGAVSVAVNTSYKGSLLEHVLDNSDATVALVHPDLLERIPMLESHGILKVVFTSRGACEAHAEAFRAIGITLRPLSELERGGGDLSAAEGLMPWDTQSIVYTSGTTGPSKGVLSSYLHLYMMGFNCTRGVDDSDRFLINLPLFHVGGTLFVTGALVRGASVAVMESFRSESFLGMCRDMGVTQCLLLGAMAGFLMRSQPSEKDKDHHLRRVMVIPLSEDPKSLSERFGFDVFTLFNMSEISAPIISDLNPTALGACGKLVDTYQARIVDENDCEMPIGEPGELVLRADTPWVFFHGYYKMPEATAKAWRNGWFHTGDMFSVDERGDYYFVDRVKDAIRRRGENISSFEVEREVLTHDDVFEAAAVGVPGDGGEEEVLVAVVPREGIELDSVALVTYLEQRLPYFMVPRFIRPMDELPKTPTAKIEKHVLRSEGVTSGTWDREVAGLSIKREHLTVLSHGNRDE